MSGVKWEMLESSVNGTLPWSPPGSCHNKANTARCALQHKKLNQQPSWGSSPTKSLSDGGGMGETGFFVCLLPILSSLKIFFPQTVSEQQTKYSFFWILLSLQSSTLFTRFVIQEKVCHERKILVLSRPVLSVDDLVTGLYYLILKNYWVTALDGLIWEHMLHYVQWQLNSLTTCREPEIQQRFVFEGAVRIVMTSTSWGILKTQVYSKELGLGLGFEWRFLFPISGHVEILCPIILIPVKQKTQLQS